jgi:hypothetical protein
VDEKTRLTQLRIAQQIVDDVASSALDAGNIREFQIANTAGILICELRGDDKGPGVVAFDLPSSLRRAAKRIERARDGA